MPARGRGEDQVITRGMDQAQAQLSCSDCGVSLNDAPSDQPCPACGSDAKTFHAFASDVGTISDHEEAVVEYEVGRNWNEQWGRIKRHHSQLQSIYEGTDDRPPNAWKDVMGDFAVAVHHFAEWLNADGAVPKAVGTKAKAYVHSDPFLRLAVSVSNSYKHHTRREGVQANISSIYSSSLGNAITIGWTDAENGTGGTEDGLQLANACVSAWDTFLTSHSLSP